MIENPVPWPDGKKCAVAITFDMDSDSIMHLGYPNNADNYITTLSWLKYDQIAIPRILKLFKEYNLKQTFFVPAWCVEKYPKTVELILKDGHEIAHHGYLHEHVNEYSYEDELYFFQKGAEILKNFTGKKPSGWRSPSYTFSKNSAEILAKEGVIYDSSLMGDDVPYILKTDAGKIMELPTDWLMDDWTHHVHDPILGKEMPIKTFEQASEVYLEYFDAIWEYGGVWISVWHPFVTGRLSRFSKVPKMIEYMMSKGDVWFATLEEIAQHVQKCIDDGTYNPREDNIPYYDGRIEETKTDIYKNL